MAKSKKEKPQFSITLQLGKDVYSGAGATALEALTSLPKPDKIMAKGIVTTTFDNLTKQQLMQPPRIKRIFYSSNALRPIIAKQLFLGLK